MWQTPEMLYPSLSKVLNVGLNGDLVEQPVAEERGYVVENRNTTIQLGIPYNAEGGYRKVGWPKHVFVEAPLTRGAGPKLIFTKHLALSYVEFHSWTSFKL